MPSLTPRRVGDRTHLEYTERNQKIILYRINIQHKPCIAEFFFFQHVGTYFLNGVLDLTEITFTTRDLYQYTHQILIPYL